MAEFEEQSEAMAEIANREAALKDFLDGRGAESPHLLAQELEALFEAAVDIQELIPIRVSSPDDQEVRQTLLTFLKANAAGQGHAWEREVEQWVQAFLTNW